MRIEDSRQIAEQNASYRRGVVLGLTMAEVGILIIFVLLLLIGFNEWAKAVERETSVQVPKPRYQELSAKETQLAEVVAAVGLPAVATTEEIRTLVRTVIAAASTVEGKSALRELQEALATIT